MVTIPSISVNKIALQKHSKINHRDVGIIKKKDLIKLIEANIIGVFSEALTANVQAIFADQTMTVRAGTAASGALAVFTWMRIPKISKTHVGICSRLLIMTIPAI